LKERKAKYSGILLAAGNSSRMKKWKIEIEIQNVPLLFHSLKKLETVCDEVIVVGGCNFDKLVELIERNKIVETKNIKVICNQQYQTGMFSSIKAGAEIAQHENVFIALADMPFISIETYNLLKTKFEAEKKYDFIQPAMLLENGKRKKGHPVLINEKVKSTIKKGNDTLTLRDVLKKFSGNSFLSEDLGIGFDIDTETDLLNAEKIFYKKMN